MSKDIVNYEEMLGQLAKEATQVEKPSGSSIGTRAGVLSYNGQPVPGNKLDVIVIAATHTNLFYEDKYDPNNMTNPVCFAYSESGQDMKPHPNSAKPQHDNCDLCPRNQWGSDPDGGRGKACKNSRSLGLIPATTAAEDIPTAEIAVLKLPVMSVKNWQMYVQKCAALHNRPPLGLVTRIGTVPDQKSQFRVTFEDVKDVDISAIKPLLDRRGAVQELLEKPYDANPVPATDAPAGKPKKF